MLMYVFFEPVFPLVVAKKYSERLSISTITMREAQSLKPPTSGEQLDVNNNSNLALNTLLHLFKRIY